MDNNESKKLENAISFYMLANNLKYKTIDGYQSLADQIFGSMVLANAINSEYSKVDNLGEVIRIILLGTMDEHCHEELTSTLKNMSKCNQYTNDLLKYYDVKDLDNKSGRFAFDCVTLELLLAHFFDVMLENQDLNIEELYNIAKQFGLIDNFGNDDKKNFEIFRFYYLNRVLKNKIRSGWDSKHWNVSAKRTERISEHTVGTVALATALNSEFDFNINLDYVSCVLSIHEVGEIGIGDITPFDGITKEQKQEIEHKAIIEVIGNLSNRNNMIDSIFEFDKQETDESKFAYYCDKMEADIQAKVYQDRGEQHPLNDQENNVVFKSSKVQKMIQDGATTAFDIWYEWDKPVYTSEPVFQKTLSFIKNTKLI